MKNYLSDEVKTVIEQFAAYGYTAYAVGGCVRDSLLSATPKDWDVCSPATPEMTKEIFKDFKVIDTGIRHGTVTVLVNDKPIEITTFRTEGAYSDRRHPDFVSFTADIAEDLKRRDFTINAMAYNPAMGLVDIAGGQEDLKNKLIRTVGNANERFSEDPLRILRALRFSASLGFKIENKTAESVLTLYPLLGDIAAERIFAELRLLLCGENLYYVLSEFTDVFCFLFPEISHSFKDANTCTFFGEEMNLSPSQIFEAVAAVKDVFSLRAAMLFSAASISDAEKIALRLRFDRATTGRILNLLEAVNNPIPTDKPSMKRLINSYGFETVSDYLLSAEALSKVLKDGYADIFGRLVGARVDFEEIKQKGEAVEIKDLHVTGNDIKKLGYKGTEVGRVLSFLLDAVIDGRIQNKKQDLLDFARRYSSD